VANDLGQQDRMIRFTTIVDLPFHASKVGPDEPNGREYPTVRLLASHLIATAIAQESGQLRWQNLRTGRARWQLADLSGTGHRSYAHADVSM
jgi:hypothetical protein